MKEGLYHPSNLESGQTIRGFVPGQRVFGRYELKKILGRGGMGVVWLAQDEKLEREVALKFLPEVVALDAVAADDLKRETRKSLDLTHPNIVRIYDLVSDESSAGIAMEYVNGKTLGALRLEKGQRVFECEEIRGWMEQICNALEYAHTEAKMVHRDLKPANIMVTAEGKAKIADFGIAKSISDSVSRVSVQHESSGTPAYMSPQQRMGEKPSALDDIYSLGATIYDLLTGKPPFYSGDIGAQVMGIVPPRMSERRKELGSEGKEIPEAWEKVVSDCLEKDPAKRPQTMLSMLEILSGRKKAAEEKQESNVSMSPSPLWDKPDGALPIPKWGWVVAVGMVLLVAFMMMSRDGSKGESGGGNSAWLEQMREEGNAHASRSDESLNEMFSRIKPREGGFLIGIDKIIEINPHKNINSMNSDSVQYKNLPLYLSFGKIAPNYPFCIELKLNNIKLYPPVSDAFEKTYHEHRKNDPLFRNESNAHWDEDRPLKSGGRLLCQAGLHDFNGDGIPELVVLMGYTADAKSVNDLPFQGNSLQVWAFHQPHSQADITRQENWELLLSDDFQSRAWIHGRQITTPIGSRDGWRYTLVDGKFIKSGVWLDQNGNYNSY